MQVKNSKESDPNKQRAGFFVLYLCHETIMNKNKCPSLQFHA